MSASNCVSGRFSTLPRALHRCQLPTHTPASRVTCGAGGGRTGTHRCQPTAGESACRWQTTASKAATARCAMMRWVSAPRGPSKQIATHACWVVPGLQVRQAGLQSRSERIVLKPIPYHLARQRVASLSHPVTTAIATRVRVRVRMLQIPDRFFDMIGAVPPSRARPRGRSPALRTGTSKTSTLHWHPARRHRPPALPARAHV